MARDIKTKPTREKTIKTLDRSVIYSQKMKDKLVTAKDKLNQEKDAEENEVQYATDSITYSAGNVTKRGTQKAEQETRLVYEKVKNKKIKEKIITSEQKKQIKKRADSAINVGRGIKKKDIKAKDLKLEPNNIKDAHTTAKETLLKLKMAVTKIGQLVKGTVIATIVTVKNLILLIKGLVSLIVAGGTIAVVVIILICLIGLFFVSPFGLFFSNESEITEESITLSSTMEKLNNEVEEEINEIKEKVNHNSFRLDTFDIKWKEILTYYAVTSSNREVTSSLLNMNESEYKRLEKVFWNVVDIDYKTEKYTKTVTSTDKDGNVTKKKVSRKRLIVEVKTKAQEEVNEKYDFTESELKQIYELLSGDYDALWENLID